jgi:peptidyl-prolyl cis-trans isomerase SurA
MTIKLPPNFILKIFLLLSALTLSFNSYALLKPLDKIIVIVNNDIITQTMLKNRLSDFQKQLELGRNTNIDPDAIRKQVIERMIRDQIQLQQAKQFGITVDDLSLNRMLEQLAKNNQMTLEKFRDTIESEGLSYTRFREQTRNEIIINKLQQRLVANKVSVSEQEIAQHISQNKSEDSSSIRYHLRHILIAIPEAASAEDIAVAKQKAEATYEKISKGEKFQDLALKMSNGRNALKGGDLGERKENELPQLFIDAIKPLKPGDTSRPVKSASGFHLLQLVESSKDQTIVQQIHARHILIRTNADRNDEQARQKLLEIKQTIENGGNFSELANQFSDDPGSKTKGGDLGWSDPGDLVTEFENVAKSTTTGQLSEPFKSPFGWHLLEVLEKRNQDRTKENKEGQARAAIKKRKIDEELRLWLRRIRDEAYVEFIEETS